MEKVTVTAFKSTQDVARVRRLFFDNLEDLASSEMAIEQVAVWRSRGRIPHGIDATAQIVSVMMQDAQMSKKTGKHWASSKENGLNSSVTALGPVEAGILRLAYASALVRFVNGILDPFQDGGFAAALSTLAKNIGLPVAFVEIRHSATHDQMPSLESLRKLSSKALDWLYEKYWTAADPSDSKSQSPAPFAPPVFSAASTKSVVMSLLRQYKKTPSSDKKGVQGTVAALVDVAGDLQQSGILLKVLVEKVLLKDASFGDLLARNRSLLEALPASFLLRLVYAMLLENDKLVNSWISWLVPRILKGPFPFKVGYEYADASSVKQGLENYCALLSSDREKHLRRVLEGKSPRAVVPSLDDVLASGGESLEPEPRPKRQKVEIYHDWVPVPFGVVP